MHRLADLDVLPGICHGFFGRDGGVSDGLYASLNCGFGSGDDPERVGANRERALAAADLRSGSLVTAYQTHSAAVATVDQVWPREAAPRVDAMVTDRPAIALGILTADCAPVLFADMSARVIGAAHAGWRGALGGVLEATVAAMEKLGAARSRVVAAAGPMIRQPSYEVGADLVERFLAADRDNARFFTAGRPGHAMFDLPGY